MFIFICPHCSGEFEAQDDWVGMEAECPNCNQTIKVEKQSSSIPTPPEAKAVLPEKTPKANMLKFVNKKSLTNMLKFVNKKTLTSKKGKIIISLVAILVIAGVISYYYTSKAAAAKVSGRCYLTTEGRFNDTQHNLSITIYLFKSNDATQDCFDRFKSCKNKFTTASREYKSLKNEDNARLTHAQICRNIEASNKCRRDMRSALLEISEIVRIINKAKLVNKIVLSQNGFFSFPSVKDGDYFLFAQKSIGKQAVYWFIPFHKNSLNKFNIKLNNNNATIFSL